MYPDDDYAPLVSLSNNDYHIGMSLQYPVLDYKHEVDLYYWVNPNSTKANVCLRMNDHAWTNLVNNAGDIADGETREYTLSVTVVRRNGWSGGEPDNAWMYSFQNYRRYFWWLYGPTQYTRDPEPVRGHLIAYDFLIDCSVPTTNEYGFDNLGTSNARPDLYGWKTWAGQWNAAHSRGWNRLMNWAMSGLYRNRSRQCGGLTYNLNYPMHFATYIDDHTYDPGGGPVMTWITDVSSSTGISFGMWWGRSSSKVPASWDPDTTAYPAPVRINLGSTSEKDDAKDELAEAVDTYHASEIGLDAMSWMPTWDKYAWIKELQDYRNVRYIHEQRGSDIDHTIMPIYAYLTWNTSLQGAPQTHCNSGYDGYLRWDAPLIQDFLNPNHETWGEMHGTWIVDYVTICGSGTANASEMEDFLEEIASRGFVPMYLPFSSIPLSTNVDMEADESWTSSVPTVLQP